MKKFIIQNLWQDTPSADSTIQIIPSAWLASISFENHIMLLPDQTYTSGKEPSVDLILYFFDGEAELEVGNDLANVSSGDRCILGDVQQYSVHTNDHSSVSFLEIGLLVKERREL